MCPSAHRKGRKRMEDPPAARTEESSEDNSYYHYHMRMTAEMCFTVNTELVNSTIFNGMIYQDQMPEPTKRAYQQLLTSMLTNPPTTRHLLPTLLPQKPRKHYYHQDDI